MKKDKNVNKGCVYMSDISVIGIGNIGKLVINKIAEYNNKVQTIYITKDGEEIKECYANIILNLSENLEKRLEQIIFRKRVFIVGHIGEKQYNEINVQICKKLKKEGKEVNEICSFPFTFEGRSSLNSACDTIKILGEELNKLIVTDCDLIIKDIDKKTSIKEAFELVAEILYSNLQDTFRKVEMKYQKVIVDHNEKCEEMRKMEMKVKGISEELGNTCCLMMKKRKIREE